MSKFYKEDEIKILDTPSNSKFIDISNQEFGRLTVIGFAGNFGGRNCWFCKCECGNVIKSRIGHLKSGNSKSCGCFSRDRASEVKKIHGFAGGWNRTYNIWTGMNKRCNNPNFKDYHHYGGRGIKVCERWLKFENFLEDMGEAPDKMSLDRVDVNGDYGPGNCRWATSQEQLRNTRVNRMVEYNGVKKPISQWEDELGFKRGVVYSRIFHRGWNTERALETPVLK